jgi:hypothetical protein
MSWKAIGRSPTGRNDCWANPDWPGVEVHHCGHPTALHPYYINIAPGRAYKTLAKACEFVESRIWPVIGEPK